MTQTYYAIVTNLGAAKIANAAALGTKLNITQMAVGDGNGVLPTPTATQTALVHEVRRAAINALSIDGDNTSQIIAEQVIPETEGGFWIREMGLFAEDGTLIAVCNTPPTYKPTLQEGSGRTQTVRMIIIVNSTDAITLKIDPAVVLATRQYVDTAVIEVKTHSDDLIAEHIAASNPHKQYLQAASALKEIKDAGLVGEALKALGIGMAGLRDVGTEDNQLPDISNFTGGLMENGWAKIPLAGGRNLIVQAGSYGSSDTTSVSYKLNFPIVFPKGCAGLVVTSWQGQNGAVFGHQGRNASGASINRASTSVPFYFDWIAVGE